jgi:hypothetical protein
VSQKLGIRKWHPEKNMEKLIEPCYTTLPETIKTLLYNRRRGEARSRPTTRNLGMDFFSTRASYLENC